MTHDPTPAEPADPLVGAVLTGRYRVEARIGRGGMASVYRAVDETLGRTVALKVFAAHADGIDEPARRRSETALLASVEHRALVRLYDAAADASTGRRFLVMEFVDGTDLGAALAAGPLPADETARIAVDLAEALHVIHARGIVHRDVKPANVLLEPARVPGRRWNAKLADFGVARLVDDARLTSTGLVIGTPAYLSPEQVAGDASGPASDVYSLGLVLLEALTGARAFPGPAVEAAAARMARDPDVPDSLGPGWAALLRAMTARPPLARPSALAVATAAAELLAAPADAAGTARTLVLPAAAVASEPGSEPDSPTVISPAPNAPTVVLAAEPVGAGGAGSAGPAGAAADDAATRRRRRRITAAVLLAALATGAVALAVALGATGSGEPERVPAPTTPTPSPTAPTPAPSETADPGDDAPGKSDDRRNDDKGKGKKGEGKDKDAKGEQVDG